MKVPAYGTFYIFKGIDVFDTTNLISKKLMFKFEHQNNVKKYFIKECLAWKFSY